ncbi:hypothetical protein [Leptothoe sp. PORK10 BA2]|uniref:hypothetical protein n=1 Tax=Leptothoe sp. PORK10 BA2 TaxID=3110254 RepID=UPI002B1FB5C1|nr:hypothetical protein [Leptothoe sp. PORK10 BA2]MEA5462764.1 hypothetical protein [Leptothoe sp. PORK10 BA2]
MGLSKSNPATHSVKLLVSSSSGRVPWRVLSGLTLGGGVVLMAVVILSGAKLIVDPHSPNWLKQAFPGLANNFEAVPQTSAEILAEMKSQGITPGEPIAWPRVDQPQAWFYPILSTDDRSITELWVYRVQGDQLQRVDQVAIRPLKESFITNPLVGSASQVVSIESDATLTSVKLMPIKSADVPWLLLEGQGRYGNTVIRYGQILSYQPSSQRIHRLLNWSSPAGKLPQLQTAETGDQLLIDQTVGLRPSFLLYQIISNDPPRLQEVSLYQSVYASDVATSLYEKALQLAQGAVWSHSLQMMQSAKVELGPDWSPAAQNQLHLIGLHAKRTQEQTKQTWSSQQQHIWAYLIDGQWEQALTILESNPELYGATLKRLETDFDALWRSVTVHLQVHPKDVASQIWGTLLVTARQSPEVGKDWLMKKAPGKITLERLQALGRSPLESAGETITSGKNLGQAGTQAASAPLAAATHPGRYLGLVGQATAVVAPEVGWLRSQSLPTPLPGQTWYHIDIQLLQDSAGWGRPPNTITAANFWAESLSLRRQLQLFNGHLPVAGLTVHGVKTMGSGLALLAIGPKLESGTEPQNAGPVLVTTGHGLQWLPTLPWQATPPVASLPNAISAQANAGETTAQTMASPADPIPDAITLMVHTIGSQLGLTPGQMSELYPHLQYASLDLMGDPTAEKLFHLGSHVPPGLAIAPGKTMIFSGAGELLYSDVGQQQSLLALAAKSADRPATLLVEQAGRYTLTGL